MSGSTSPSAIYFKVNSAFDPNGGGVGHQPSYFDTLSGIYARYYVRQFKMRVDLANPTTLGSYCVACYSDQQISTYTVEQLTEAKYSVMKTLGPNTAQSTKVIDLPWMTTAKIMGQPYAEADDNQYAAVTADPTDLCFGICRVAAVDGTTTTTMYARVTLYQEIVFKDLLTQSTS